MTRECDSDHISGPLDAPRGPRSTTARATPGDHHGQDPGRKDPAAICPLTWPVASNGDQPHPRPSGDPARRRRDHGARRRGLVRVQRHRVQAAHPGRLRRSPPDRVAGRRCLPRAADTDPVHPARPAPHARHPAGTAPADHVRADRLLPGPDAVLRGDQPPAGRHRVAVRVHRSGVRRAVGPLRRTPAGPAPAVGGPGLLRRRHVLRRPDLGRRDPARPARRGRRADLRGPARGLLCPRRADGRRSRSDVTDLLGLRGRRGRRRHRPAVVDLRPGTAGRHQPTAYRCGCWSSIS